MQQPIPHIGETRSRSIAKTVTYRIIVVVLDFVILYLFTHRVDISLGFTVVSNLYTTFAYYLHERMWDNILWGKNNGEKTLTNANSMPL